MLVAFLSDEYVRWFEADALFSTVPLEVHIHFAAQDNKRFGPIVDAPPIRLIRPVQANSSAINFRKITRRPSR